MTIGTRISAEQLVLGQLYKQALEEQGFTVELKQNIGSGAIAERALRRGEIDLYPALLPDRTLTDGVTPLAPAAFAIAEAIAVPPALARAHELETIADLRRLDRIRLGARPEFLADGLASLTRAYGLGAVTFAPLTSDLQYRMLADGKLDAALVTTTDGTLHEADCVVLEDPLRAFAVRHLTPVVRESLLAVQPPAFRATIDAVSRALSTDAMRRLNAAVQLDGETPADAARRFLEEHELG